MLMFGLLKIPRSARRGRSAGPRCRCNSIEQSGFTILNMIATLMIASIISYVAMSQLSTLSATFNRINARSNLLQDLKRAQAEAITQGCRGIFLIASDARSYSFGCDYLAYDTSNPPHSDEVSFVRALPEHVVLSSDAPVIFNSRGEAVDVNNIMSNITLTLSQNWGGTPLAFARGILLGTGVFTYVQ